MKVKVNWHSKKLPTEDGQYLVTFGYKGNVHVSFINYTVEGGWNTHRDQNTGKLYAGCACAFPFEDWGPYIRAWAKFPKPWRRKDG